MMTSDDGCCSADRNLLLFTEGKGGAEVNTVSSSTSTSTVEEEGPVYSGQQDDGVAV